MTYQFEDGFNIGGHNFEVELTWRGKRGRLTVEMDRERIEESDGEVGFPDDGGLSGASAEAVRRRWAADAAMNALRVSVTSGIEAIATEDEPEERARLAAIISRHGEALADIASNPKVGSWKLGRSAKTDVPTVPVRPNGGGMKM